MQWLEKSKRGPSPTKRPAAATRSVVSLKDKKLLEPTNERDQPLPVCSSAPKKQYCDNKRCTASEQLWRRSRQGPASPSTLHWIVVDEEHVRKMTRGPDWSGLLHSTVCQDCQTYFECFGALPAVPYPFTVGCKVLVDYGEEFGKCEGHVTDAEPNKDGWEIRVPASDGCAGDTFRCVACLQIVASKSASVCRSLPSNLHISD